MRSRGRPNARSDAIGSLTMAMKPQCMLVTGKRGAVVRAAADLGSDKLSEIPKGSFVFVDDADLLTNGTRRLHLTYPIAGWASARQPERMLQ